MGRIDFTGIAYLGALGLAALVAYQIYQKGGSVANAVSDAVDSVKAALPDAIAAVNPASDKNVASMSVNKFLGNVTGNKEFSLGASLYDLLHPSEIKAFEQLTTKKQINVNDFQTPGITPPADSNPLLQITPFMVGS